MRSDDVVCTYPGEPDRSRSDVKVHQVVDDTALQIILDTVDDDLLAHVHELEVGVLALVAVVVQRLVDLLVIADAVPEVLGGLFRVLATVVRAGELDVADVGHDEVLVVAFALDKDDLDPFLCAGIENPLAAFFGRVGRVQYADDSAAAKPGQHVGDGSLGGGPPLLLALFVIHVEEVRGRVGRIVATVVADIEGLRWDRQPLEIALGWVHVSQWTGRERGGEGVRGCVPSPCAKPLSPSPVSTTWGRGNRLRCQDGWPGEGTRTFLSNVALAPGGQPHHDNTYLYVLGLDSTPVDSGCRHSCAGSGSGRRGEE